MRTKKNLTLLVLAALILGACGPAAPSLDPEAYEQQVLEWRAGRLARLLAPDGYLTQIGLFWLDAGSYTLGSGAENDIRLPANAAAEVGSLEVTGGVVHMRVADGVEVLSAGEPVTDILIADDTSPEPVQLTHESIAWTVIKRDDRVGVRVRDYEHPFVATFGPLPYFPIDASLRVQGTLKRYDEPRIANVGTVIEGLGYHPESPGVVEFEIGGETHELEAYTSGDRLFFVFGDATNRDDTYGAGRFLYADVPGENGQTILDFNMSYSPPCAFNDFSTCPVASPRNRLPIRIEAGEKYDKALHYSAAASL